MHQNTVAQVNSDSSQLPHQVDDALTSIRAIRAQHRAEVIANGLRLVDPISDALRVSIIHNIADRLDVFCAMAKFPEASESLRLEHATRIVDAVLGLTRGVR